MFEFLTRRHAAPAETPLSEVRFTREDLFVLLGGFDTGMFANGPYSTDLRSIELHGADPWRRDMAARLSSTGLVDAEGTPSDELVEALYPLNKPGVAIDDGASPQSARKRDSRTTSAVFYMESGTAIRRLPGRRSWLCHSPVGRRRGMGCCVSWRHRLSAVGPLLEGSDSARARGQGPGRGDVWRG